jgi:molecular chaperone DnaK
VNPDEVVAVGAAIQGGVLGGDVKDVVLLDVTPLSLGVETLGGAMTVLIPRNTTIPTRKSEVFSTADDNQTAVDIHVLQGERPLAKDNRTLGRFRLEGIPPAPRGVPQIEVAFDIDANGILNVSAKDMATGKEQRITISGTGTLAKEEIDRMVKEATQHADEDKERRADIDVRNTADARVYQIEKLLDENRDKVPAEDDRATRAALEEVRKALAAGGRAGIESALKELEKASHKLAETLYRTGGDPQGAPGAGSNPAGGGEAGSAAGGGPAAPGDVIDAEYVDVDEAKG